MMPKAPKEPPPRYTLSTLLVATAVAVVVTDIETDIEGCLRYLGADADSPQAPVAAAENGTFALAVASASPIVLEKLAAQLAPIPWVLEVSPDTSVQELKQHIGDVLGLEPERLVLSLLPSAEELAEERASLASFDLHAGSAVKLSLRTVPPRLKRRLQKEQEARRISSMWPEGTAAWSVGTVTLQQTVKEKDGA